MRKFRKNKQNNQGFCIFCDFGLVLIRKRAKKLKIGVLDVKKFDDTAETEVSER